MVEGVLEKKNVWIFSSITLAQQMSLRVLIWWMVIRTSSSKSSNGTYTTFIPLQKRKFLLWWKTAASSSIFFHRRKISGSVPPGIWCCESIHQLPASEYCSTLIPISATIQNMSEDFLKSFLKNVPLMRLGQPEDIENSCVFFVIDSSAFIFHYRWIDPRCRRFRSVVLDVCNVSGYEN